MKKILLPILFLFTGIFATIAQTTALEPPPPSGGSLKCDSLTVDSVILMTSPARLKVSIHNETQIFVAYPMLDGMLDPNPYIKLDTAASIASVLDVSGGTNGGMTDFYIVVDSLKPADSIPAGTVFTGHVHLADPTDTVIYCDYDITFTYGSGTVDILDVTETPITVQVNGNQLLVKGDIQNMPVQVLNITGQLVLADNNTRGANTRTIEIGHLPAGMYFVAMQRNNQLLVRKFMKD